MAYKTQPIRLAPSCYEFMLVFANEIYKLVRLLSIRIKRLFTLFNINLLLHFKIKWTCYTELLSYYLWLMFPDVGPSWAPCRPHAPCYQGYYLWLLMCSQNTSNLSVMTILQWVKCHVITNITVWFHAIIAINILQRNALFYMIGKGPDTTLLCIFNYIILNLIYMY